MRDHDAPPLADSGAADRLVDDMGLFLRGGPVPDTTDEVPGVPDDRTMSFDGAPATADPGAWTPSPAGLDTAPDLEIGPYRVIRFVGHGGMGNVYHARHRVLPREAALKTIRARLAGDPGILERFLVEAKAVENLDHPNVVKLYEFDERASEPYIAMEWVPGGDLSRRLEAGALPPRKAAVLVRALADAMAYAHGRGVLHRDLKPQNVLLAADGTPKVADFGLARLLAGDDSGWRLTQTGAVMGTPAYMAPEQASGKDGDVRTDVYALGAILYEVLTAKPLFAGASKDAVLKQVRESDPPRPSSLAGGVPADLESICLRCLSKHADDRYQTAAELVADLDRFLAGEPLPRSPWRRLRRAARAVRKRWRWAAVAGACVASALVAFVATRPPGPPDGVSPVARAELENELRAGRPARLIAPTGWPKWFKWVGGAPAGQKLFLDPDRLLVAESHDDHAPSLLELLPDPTTPRYRVTAQVRNDWSKPSARVGFYVAHRAYPHQPRDVLSAVTLGFNGATGSPGTVYPTRGDPKGLKVLVPEGTGAVELSVQLFTVGPNQKPYTFGEAGAGGKRLSALGAHSGRWYDIEITVTPDGVTAALDGDTLTFPAPAIDRATTDAHALLLARDPTDQALRALRPVFAPGGGLGVYLSQAGVSVRNVTVSPLSP